MSKHVSISASEAADRLAIRELVEACGTVAGLARRFFAARRNPSSSVNPRVVIFH